MPPPAVNAVFVECDFFLRVSDQKNEARRDGLPLAGVPAAAAARSCDPLLGIRNEEEAEVEVLETGQFA